MTTTSSPSTKNCSAERYCLFSNSGYKSANA
jgi:hypothetical protein